MALTVPTSDLFVVSVGKVPNIQFSFAMVRAAPECMHITSCNASNKDSETNELSFNLLVVKVVTNNHMFRTKETRLCQDKRGTYI